MKTSCRTNNNNNYYNNNNIAFTALNVLGGNKKTIFSKSNGQLIIMQPSPMGQTGLNMGTWFLS